MKKKTKFAFKGYLEPTPSLFRKIGDGLLGASTTAQTWAILEDMKWLAITFMLVGVVGKYLSNFFTEVPHEEVPPT